ncbi:MAG: Crp/Fnr family transcriptional regulator [Bradyrhizobiaceae bacterium]|nr:Crp/Fnr family transcriptional regulator [Bradyrhizobiaceae bacterium]
MAVDDDIVFLGRIPTFRVLGREAMRIIAISAQPVQLQGGDQLFEEGEPADGGYVVVYGSIELKGMHDREPGERAIARSGTLIGETALVVNTLRPATATATETTLLLRIPRNIFLRTLEGEPGAAAALRDMMAKRLISTLHDLDLVAPLFEAKEEAGEETEPEN